MLKHLLFVSLITSCLCSNAQFGKTKYKVDHITTDSELKKRKAFIDQVKNSKLVFIKLDQDSTDQSERLFMNAFLKAWTFSPIDSVLDLSSYYPEPNRFHQSLEDPSYNGNIKKHKRFREVMADPKYTVVFIYSGSLTSTSTYTNTSWGVAPHCYLEILTGKNKQKTIDFPKVDDESKQYMLLFPHRSKPSVKPNYAPEQPLSLINQVMTTMKRMDEGIRDTIYKEKIEKNRFSTFYGDTRDRLITKTIYYPENTYSDELLNNTRRDLKLIKMPRYKAVSGEELHRLMESGDKDALILYWQRYSLYFYDCAEKRIVIITD